MFTQAQSHVMTNTIQADATVSHPVSAAPTVLVADRSATSAPTTRHRHSIAACFSSIPRTIGICLQWLTSDNEPQLPPSVQLMIGPNGAPIWHRNLGVQNRRGGDHDFVD